MRTFRIAAWVVALVAGSHASAQSIVFYEGPNLDGRSYGSDRAVSDLVTLGFLGRAASLLVRGGTWQVCTDASFRGRCVDVGPGEYRNLPQSVGVPIASAQPIPGATASPLPPPPQQQRAAAPPAPPPAPPTLIVFEGENFAGASIGLAEAMSNLDATQFNDRIRSVVVTDGVWELCIDDAFRGCQAFGPGEHPTLGMLTGRVSSLRPVGAGGAPVAILYELPGFSGLNVAIDQDVDNFDPLGLNDRAQSLRVVRGQWMFCTDAGFGGECRTFGPGDYPQFDPTFARRISSARRLDAAPR
jgi:hypothetical protein